MGFAIKENDTRPWALALKEDGEPADLSSVSTLRCHVFAHGSTAAADQLMNSTAVTVVGDSTNGNISVAPTSSQVTPVGSYDLEIQLTYNDGTVGTWPNHGFEELTIGTELA